MDSRSGQFYVPGAASMRRRDLALPEKGGNEAEESQ